jgi:RNA polymerase sigma factor (sigma-70 family)
MATAADRSFEELFGRHREALARYCRTLVRDEHDAVDVLQNVAVRALLAVRRGAGPTHERAWLYRIARNEAVTLFRSRRRLEQLDESATDPARDPVRVVLERERLGELASDLRALSPNARRILLLSSAGGLDRDQIAAELSLTPGAVSQSLSESRAGLRADRAGHELSCDELRSLLDGADGRRWRARAVRAHLRGCAGCRDWAQRRGKRAGAGALLPAPFAAVLRWVQPILGGDPGTAALALRSPGIGPRRALALVVSLVAGAPGAGAGGAPTADRHRAPVAARAVAARGRETRAAAERAATAPAGTPRYTPVAHRASTGVAVPHAIVNVRLAPRTTPRWTPTRTATRPATQPTPPHRQTWTLVSLPEQQKESVHLERRASGSGPSTAPRTAR